MKWPVLKGALSYSANPPDPQIAIKALDTRKYFFHKFNFKFGAIFPPLGHFLTRPPGLIKGWNELGFFRLQALLGY